MTTGAIKPSPLLLLIVTIASPCLKNAKPGSGQYTIYWRYPFQTRSSPIPYGRRKYPHVLLYSRFKGIVLATPPSIKDSDGDPRGGAARGGADLTVCEGATKHGDMNNWASAAASGYIRARRSAEPFAATWWPRL